MEGPSAETAVASAPPSPPSGHPSSYSPFYSLEQHLFVKALREQPIPAIIALINSTPIDQLRSLRCPLTNATPLFFGVQRPNDAEAVTLCKILVDEYSLYNPTQVDKNLQTALYFAARDGNTQTCEYMIEKGCDHSHRDNAAQTPLFYACRDGRTETALALIRAGVNPNITDGLQQTALFYAARDNRLETVKALVEEGHADPNVRDRKKQTAANFASKAGKLEVAQYLRSFPATRPDSFHHKRSSTDLVSNVSSSSPGVDSPMSPPAAACNEPPRKKYRLQFLVPAPETSMEESYQTSLAEADNTSGLTCPFWLFAPECKVIEFERRFPELAVWPKESPVPEYTCAAYAVAGSSGSGKSKSKVGAPVVGGNLSNPFLRDWYRAAYELMMEVSRYEGGWIFEKPVDAKKLRCPDYYDVIKKPMDFAIIKGKLRKLQYNAVQEFLDDVQLVFDNCHLYNKNGTWVALHGTNLERYFRNLQITRHLDKYAKREADVQALLEITRKENEEAAPMVKGDTAELSVSASTDDNKAEQQLGDVI
eukprot:GHVS01086157.1.p1 GENE.GHVS01086157.1~~GHVS01086157.1.p1  ORF type:complete len:537 (+),score=75.66 GHVS01086157.1:150-1760(+)